MLYFICNRGKHLVDYLREVMKMIYDKLKELDADVESNGVSPLFYVVLNCGR